MQRVIFAALMVATLAAAPAEPVTWTVDAASSAPVKAGERITVKLAAHIDDGWHLYGMKPMPDGPIPTRIWIPEGQPFSLASAVQAGRALTLNDPTFGMEVEIYKREAVFTLPVRIARNAAAGPQKMMVNASYQTCDSKICLPPKTVKVEVPLSVSR